MRVAGKNSHAYIISRKKALACVRGKRDIGNFSLLIVR
jgi:hypothetical protein